MGEGVCDMGQTALSRAAATIGAGAIIPSPAHGFAVGILSPLRDAPRGEGLSYLSRLAGEVGEGNSPSRVRVYFTIILSSVSSRSASSAGLSQRMR